MATILSSSRFATDLLLRSPDAGALLADDRELMPRSLEALIAEARAAGKPAPVFEGGTLPNSGLDAEGMASGVSWVTRNGFLGISRSGFNTDYGVPGHAHEGENEGGVRIRLRQRRNELQGEWRSPRATDLVQGVRLKFGRGDYRHSEIEPDGQVGTVFTNRGHDGRAEVLHGGAKGWNGAIGVQSGRNRFTADGEEAFLPNSTSRTDAVFAFEEATRGAVTWQAGARVERARVAADGRTVVNRPSPAPRHRPLEPQFSRNHLFGEVALADE